MNKVWIAFERDSGFSAWLVRKVSGFEYNHVAIIYESTDWDALWVAEAMTRGVRATPQKKRIWRKRFLINHAQIWDSLRVNAIHFGERYDYQGLVVFGLLLLCWRYLKLKVRHPLRSYKGLFCSEYLALVLNGINIKLDCPQFIDVRTIWSTCLQNPDTFPEEKDATV
jgi:hypothetical protein